MTDDPAEGVWLGACSALVGAGFMAIVWRATGRIRWPERPTVRFYLAHLAAAATFSLAWRAAVLTIDGLVSKPAGPLDAVIVGFQGPLVLWDLMFKVMMYGYTLALSYTLREGERARAEHRRAAQLDALATKAQLAALRAQLNPHFLFNTLHSLSALIRHDPVRAEEAVDRLGELLSFALRHGGHDDVAFEDEMHFVTNYLELEKLRFEDRLLVHTEIDPASLATLVPPFSVQPLIENAIRHGLAPRERGGTLRIAATIDAEALWVTVEDDGVGLNLDETERGSGIMSIRRRLEARGGGSLAIEAEGSGGTRAVLRIPRLSGLPTSLNLVQI